MFASSRRLIRLITVALAAASVLAFAPTASASGTYTLITYPDSAHTPVYDYINSATKSVDMTMYELTDTSAQNALVAAAQRGVTARVILDGAHQSVNGAAYNFLNAHGVKTVWSSNRYVYTHQKSIEVDGTSAYVSTGNLDSTYYASDRDYAVIENDPVDVAAIEQVFNADFTNTAITPNNGNHLVWSPTNAQAALLDMINSATTSLELEQLEMGSQAMTDALSNAAKRGVKVTLTMTDNGWGYECAWAQLVAAGVQLHTYPANGTPWIHAKTILADYGTPSARVFEGSENFSDTSLLNNRELGLIINDPAVMSSMHNTMAKDFAGAKPWNGTCGGGQN